ncbi:MAG: ribose-phosphate pyrophosphokinase [Alphaproteobacteria bacterium]
MQNVVLIAGQAGESLAQSLANRLGVPLAKRHIERFHDGETYVNITTPLAGKEVVVVQPTCPPVNDNLVELLALIDCCRRANVRKIHAVVPYFGYARQDRLTVPQTAISASMVARLLEASGLDHLLTLELHSPQEVGFFRIPVSHVQALDLFVTDIQAQNFTNAVVVTPDIGGVKRAKQLADALGLDLAIIHKERQGTATNSTVETLHIIGSVQGKTCILLDDMLDTGGTLAAAIHTLHQHGAASVQAYVTHGLFTPPAPARLAQAPLTRLVATNSVPAAQPMPATWRMLDVAPLFAHILTQVLNK